MYLDTAYPQTTHNFDLIYLIYVYLDVSRYIKI